VALAVGTGSLPAVLSTRAMVYGGKVSFSLYMVHELVHQGWNWAAAQYRIDMEPSWHTKFIVLGLLAGAFAGSVVLFHYVEEPARHWMRRMVESAAGDAKSDAGQRKLQAIHDSDHDSNARSSRAG
jgi:peptidoglycan/LPS O-acetylase OafA/YrhL